MREDSLRPDEQRDSARLLVNATDRDSIIENDRADLTYRDAFVALSKITGPTALIAIFYAANGFVVSLSLSELGHTELAAAALITAGQLLIYNSFSGAGRSSGILIAGKYKENDHKAAADLFHHSLLYSTILGVLSTAAILIFPYFLGAIKQPNAVVSVVHDYLFPLAIGMLPKLLLTNMRDFSFAVNNNLIPLLSAFIEQVLIAGIGYCVATGKLGIHPYGVAGFGYVSSVVSLFSLAVYGAYLFFSKRNQQYKLFRSCCAPSLADHLKKLTTLGVPIGLRIFSERAAVAFATIMAGWLGKDALSAQEIALQYMMFEIVPFYGVGRGMGILVKRYRDNRVDIRRLNTIGLGAALIVSITAFILYASCSKLLISIFLQDATIDKEAILKVAQHALLIISVTEIFDCSRSVLEGSLRGIEKTGYSMAVNLATIWCVGAPVSYALGLKAGLDLNGIFIGRGIGIVFGFSLLLYKWMRETRENPSSVLENSENHGLIGGRFSYFSHGSHAEVAAESGTSENQYRMLTV